MVNLPLLGALPYADPIIELQPVKNPIQPKIGDFIKSKNLIKDNEYYEVGKIVNIDKTFITWRILFANESRSRGQLTSLCTDMFQRTFVHAAKQDLEEIEDIKDPEPGSIEVDEIETLILKRRTFININKKTILSTFTQVKDLLLKGMIWRRKDRYSYVCKIIKPKNGSVYLKEGLDYFFEMATREFLNSFEPLFMPGDKLTYHFPSELKFNSKVLEITQISHKGPDNITIQVDGSYDYNLDELLALTKNKLVHEKTKFEEKTEKYYLDYYQEPKIGEIWCGSDVLYENMVEITDIDKENEIASVKLVGPVKYKYLPDQIFDIHFNHLNCNWVPAC